jgi:hypothetical protein
MDPPPLSEALALLYTLARPIKSLTTQSALSLGTVKWCAPQTVFTAVARMIFPPVD